MLSDVSFAGSYGAEEFERVLGWFMIDINLLSDEYIGKGKRGNKDF